MGVSHFHLRKSATLLVAISLFTALVAAIPLPASAQVTSSLVRTNEVELVDTGDAQVTTDPMHIYRNGPANFRIAADLTAYQNGPNSGTCVAQQYYYPVAGISSLLVRITGNGYDEYVTPTAFTQGTYSAPGTYNDNVNFTVPTAVMNQVGTYEVRVVADLRWEGRVCLPAVGDYNYVTTVTTSPAILRIGENVASFTANACLRTVTFNGTGSRPAFDDRPISYAWTFGDGTTGTGSVVTHTYSGTLPSFSVKLRVTDTALNGETPKYDEETQTVAMGGNRAPVAAHGGPYSVDVGNTLTLNASGSADPDSACGGSIASYRWDFDNNGTYDLVSSTATVTLTAAQVNALGVGEHALGLTVVDNLAATGSATTTLTVVGPTNAAPTATSASVSTNEDTAKLITLTGSDPEGTNVTFALGTGPSHGTLGTLGTPTCVAGTCTAQVTYTPNGDYNGADSFTFRTNDGTQDSALATISITVDSVNDAPIAYNKGPLSLFEDGSVTSPVMLGDWDDGYTTTFAEVSDPAHGSVTWVNEGPRRGDITYTPDPNYHGTDSFTYRLTDGSLTSNLATVTLNVAPMNDRPTASSYPITIPQDAPVTLTLSGFDVDGDAVVFQYQTLPAHGSLVTTGALTCNPETKICTKEVYYDPIDGYYGSDYFTFVTNDGSLVSDPATVSITIERAVNVAPVATDDALTTNEDTPVTNLNVVTNDTDPNIDTLTASGSGTTAHGTFSCDASGCDYTPAANFNGTDSFDYTVSDDRGGTDTGTVTVTVTPVNDAPTVDSFTVTTPRRTPVTIDLAPYIHDVETASNQIFSYSTTDGPYGGTLVGTGATTMTFTPGWNLSGTASFRYSVTDNGDPTGCVSESPPCAARSSSGWATVTINVVNQVPTAHPQSVTIPQDAPTTITLSAYDPEGDALVFQYQQLPQHGSMNTGLYPVSCNPVTKICTKQIVFDPVDDYIGTDSFTFLANDGYGSSAAATVSITLEEVTDHPPVATDDSMTTPEDTQRTNFNVVANDSDPEGATLISSGSGLSAHGTFSCDADGCDYTPMENFHGTDSFTYTVSDGSGGTDTGTVNVTVTPVNDQPTATPFTRTTSEDDSVEITPYPAGSDVESPTLTPVHYNSESLAGSLHRVVDGEGVEHVTFIPTPNFHGTTSFTYRVHDGGDPDGCGTPSDSCSAWLWSEPATVTITVTPVNDPPVAQAASHSTTEDTPVTFNLTGSDLEGGSLTHSIVTPPSHGTLNTGVSINCNLDGTYCTWSATYTPAANYHGPDSFTYKVSDGTTYSDTVTISLTVTPVNDQPFLDEISNKTVAEQTPLTFTAIGHDSDLPADTLTYGLLGAPEGATIDSTSGVFSWTPTEAQGPGSYMFGVRVTDAGSLSVQRAVTVTVTEVNRDPVLPDFEDKTVNEGSTVTFSAAAFDPDVPENTLVYGLSGAPAGATIDPATGVFTWTPSEAQGPGLYVFNISVRDNTTGWDGAGIAVIVNEVNSAPTLDAIADKSVNEQTELSFTAVAHDADLPANTLSYELLSAPPGATIGSSSGVFSWTPSEEQGPGTYWFTVRVIDGGSLTAARAVKVTVNEVNTAPLLASIGNKTVNEGTTLTFTAGAKDTDIPFNALSYSLVGAPAGATIGSSSGVFSWTPTEAQGPQSYTFDVKVTDSGSLTDTESITVTVNEVNVAPSLDVITDKTVNEGSFLTFTAVGHDADLPENPLSYSLVGAPAGATIGSSSGVFSWTPTEAQGPQSYTFDVKVIDSGSLTDTESITVTVNEVNAAPVLDPIGNRSVAWDGVLSFNATSNDADLPANALTFSLTGAPAGAAITSGGAFTWTPTSAQIGDHTFTVTVTDDGSPVRSDSESITVTVGKRAVSMAYDVPAGGQYSDEVTLSATLTDVVTHEALTGKTITFTLGSQSGTVSTDTTGEAEKTFTLDQPGGMKSIGAVFAGDALYQPVSDTDETFVLSRENAYIEYTGATVAPIGEGMELRATVWDSAAASYPGTNPDSKVGDVTKMSVTFAVYSGTTCTTLVETFKVPVTSIGTGIGEATATLTSSVETVMCVEARVTAADGSPNLYYAAAPADEAFATFYENTGQFITGAGWLTDGDSKAHFGFRARYTKSAKRAQPQGQLYYSWRGVYEQGDEPVEFKFKSTTISAIALPKTTSYPIAATIEGKAVIQITRLSDGELLSSIGNATFRLTATDGGGEGPDLYGLVVRLKNGVIYKSVPTTVPDGGQVIAHM